jgi:hypothetical protein
LSRHADALPLQYRLRRPELGPIIPEDHRGKGGVGVRLSRSRNVGCERELAANLADATRPQTVAVSPTWLATSTEAMVAALVDTAQRPSTADAPMSFALFNFWLADRMSAALPARAAS